MYFAGVLFLDHRPPPPELNQALPHVRKCARFDNGCPKFGVLPLNVGEKNCLFSDSLRHGDLSANIFVTKRAINTLKRRFLNYEGFPAFSKFGERDRIPHGTYHVL